MSLPKHAFKNKSSLIGSGDSPTEDKKRTDFRRVTHIPRTVIYDIFVKILVKLDKEILWIPSFGQLWFPFLPVPLMVMATLGGSRLLLLFDSWADLFVVFPIFSFFENPFIHQRDNIVTMQKSCTSHGNGILVKKKLWILSVNILNDTIFGQ